MIANGWRLYYYRLFKAALDELESVVSKLAADDPDGYKAHPTTKLLASVYRAITQLVPANPDAPDFRLGKTLGSDNANWRRVKKGMPDRYRLFSRFASNPVKVIVDTVRDLLEERLGPLLPAIETLLHERAAKI